MNTDLINKTYDLVDEIKDTKTYKRLLELSGIIKKSDAISELIYEFNKDKTKLQEAQKYGKYHPDLKKIQLNLKDSKEKLYNNDIIKEYKSCEKEIQKILNGISKELANTISSKIKYPNELGLVNKH